MIRRMSRIAAAARASLAQTVSTVRRMYSSHWPECYLTAFHRYRRESSGIRLYNGVTTAQSVLAMLGFTVVLAEFENFFL
jgi:hypothetical protein